MPQPRRLSAKERDGYPEHLRVKSIRCEEKKTIEPNGLAVFLFHL